MDELKASHRGCLRSARKKVMERCAESDKPEPDEAELRALVETDAALEMLREKHQRVVQKLDEKIAIAAQSYDLVDHHIRRLDQDLDAYAALLKQAGEFEEDKVYKKAKKAAQQPVVALPDKKQGSRSSGTASSTSASAAGTGGGSSTTSTSSGRKRSATEAALDTPALVRDSICWIIWADLGSANGSIVDSCRLQLCLSWRKTSRSTRTNLSIATAAGFRTARWSAVIMTIASTSGSTSSALG